MDTLREVLLHKTKAYRYVKIYDAGWLVAMCYIDDEDLFIGYMSTKLLERKVQSMKLVSDKDFNTEIYRVDI